MSAKHRYSEGREMRDIEGGRDRGRKGEKEGGREGGEREEGRERYPLVPSQYALANAQCNRG